MLRQATGGPRIKLVGTVEALGHIETDKRVALRETNLAQIAVNLTISILFVAPNKNPTNNGFVMIEPKMSGPSKPKETTNPFTHPDITNKFLIINPCIHQTMTSIYLPVPHLPRKITNRIRSKLKCVSWRKN